MNLLQITEGKAVADIGAGGGWFSAIASKRVGEKGIIYAVDINEDAIKYINDRKIKQSLTNVLAILGKTDDPFLPQDSVDAVLILNTYHEVAEPIKLLRNLKKSLKKNALVGIIDRVTAKAMTTELPKKLSLKKPKKRDSRLKKLIHLSKTEWIIF